MNIANLKFMSRKGAAFNLSAGDPVVEELILNLNMQHIRSLGKNPDILSQIQDICVLDKAMLISELESTYLLDIEPMDTGEYWIGVGECGAAVPDWFDEVNGHYGWLIKDEDLVDWARDFLMQNVCINLNIRYLLHKEEEKKKRHVGAGSYTPEDFGMSWLGGSGGNYP